MPYIITTDSPDERLALRGTGITRRAVATLDEARARIRNIVVESGRPGGTTADPITPTGGTVGPLPDGTVIEVRAVTPYELWREAGRPASASRTHAPPDVAVSVDAYNAAQES